MKKTILSLSLVISGLSAFAQHDHSIEQRGNEEHSIDDQSSAKSKNETFTKNYQHYLDLKNSLVLSDQNAAARAANALQNTVREQEGGSKIAKKAALIAKAASLDDQRIAFTELSNEMTILLKTNEVTSGTIYLEFCPMTNGQW